MFNFQKYKKFLSILGSMLIIVVVFKFTTTDLASGEIQVELETENLMTQTMKVHVDGAVVNQGVYELTEGARVEDAIEAAGGLTQEANDELLNYAQRLKDGEKITVLKRYERSEQSDDLGIPLYDDEAYSILEKLNYMTAEEYQMVPGIGEKISQEIIKTRETLGAFSTVEELKTVSGIGDSKYEKIISYLQ